MSTEEQIATLNRLRMDARKLRNDLYAGGLVEEMKLVVRLIALLDGKRKRESALRVMTPEAADRWIKEMEESR